MRLLIFLVTVSARLLVGDQPEAPKVLAPEKITEAKKAVVKPEATKAVVKLKEKVTEEKKAVVKPEEKVAAVVKPEEKVVAVVKPEKIVDAKTVEETTTAMADVAPVKMVEEKVVVPTTEGVSMETKKTLASFYSSLVLKNKQNPEADEELYKEEWHKEWDNGNHPSWEGHDYEAPVVPPKKKGSEAFWWLWMVVITIAIVGGLSVWYYSAHHP